mmetsp:Transcript_895/g.813  ORF Transcript_895/g.813 Transcript_895/m.813 type:complete len:208 (-) Transcript_895:173-796(-)
MSTMANTTEDNSLKPKFIELDGSDGVPSHGNQEIADSTKKNVDEENASNDADIIAVSGENNSTSWTVVKNQEIPLEMQCEEVNMEDPNMDPLEWTVRKLVPIPKAYYWETGNEDLPFKTKTWHQTVSRLGAAKRMAERIGEAVANFTGLNSSSYDYVISTMTEEQWEAAKKTAEKQKARRFEYEENQKEQCEEQTLSQDLGVTVDAL